MKILLLIFDIFFFLLFFWEGDGERTGRKREGRKRDYKNFCWVQQVSALPTTDYDNNYCKQAGVE